MLCFSYSCQVSTHAQGIENSKSIPKFAQTQKKARFLLLNNRKVLLLRCKISAPNLAEHKAIYHTHSENKKQQ